MIPLTYALKPRRTENTDSKMGMGTALGQGLATMLFAYLAFVFVAAAVIILAAHLSKRSWVLILVPVAAVLPIVLYFGIAILGILDDNNRKVEDARARLIDEPAFEKICSEPMSITILKTTVAEDDQIVITDQEASFGTFFNSDLNYLAEIPLYDGSPFTTSLQKFGVREDDPHCNVPHGGRYQCRDPEYGYWVLPFDGKKAREPVFSLTRQPRYSLEIFKPVAIGKDLTKREIVLSDSGLVLARTHIHRLEFDKKGRRSCPDQSDAVKSMISQVFLLHQESGLNQTKN